MPSLFSWTFAAQSKLRLFPLYQPSSGNRSSSCALQRSVECSWLIYDETRKVLLTPNAYGVVLDIGAGHGHTAKYLDRSKVTRYIALEPNTAMHGEIRKLAANAGFREANGTLLILPDGVEQASLIASALGGIESVDPLVSVLSLCSVPAPVATIGALVGQLLKPGGNFLFLEHVRSPRADVAWCGGRRFGLRFGGISWMDVLSVDQLMCESRR